METPDAAASGTFQIGGDVPVHRLGYGTMRLVGDGAWGEPDDPEQCRRVLRRALELGINLVDTADAYGPEIAERLIAEALYPYPPGLVIATKGGITRQGPSKTEYVGRAGYLNQCVEMSFRRLPGTSKVAHLEENVAAAGLQIGPDEWAALEAASAI
jgi:pyridoxine 4-dehydrogenase